MNRSLNALLLVLSGTLAFGQSTRMKVRVPAEPNDMVAGENSILRGARLPRLTSTHVIVQFDQAPTADVLDALTARGAVVLQDVPDNAVMVTMNGSTTLDNLGIRSAARLDPREKVSPLITDGDSSTTLGYYLVEFHPDVDLNIARRLILSEGLELNENPDLASHELMVRISERERIALLATQDAVAYIFPASEDLIAGRRAPAYSGALSALGAVGQYIATQGDGWDGPGKNAATLNYFFDRITEQLPTGVPQAEIVRAMNEWAKVIRLDWQPGSGAAGAHTVNILFAQGSHGDNYPFDRTGGVLAHTFYPALPNPEPIAGDMHLDDSETWNVGANTDLFSVALHELGHALGLGHSDNPNDVMYPYYRMASTLADGDKAAILTLYAARIGTVPAPLPPTTPTPIPVPVPTPTPAPTPIPAPAPAPVPPTGTDKSGPALTIVYPSATFSTTFASLTFRGTASDPSGVTSVTFSTNTGGAGNAAGTAQWTAAIPLLVGSNQVIIRATDSVGNVSWRSVVVTRR